MCMGHVAKFSYLLIKIKIACVHKVGELERQLTLHMHMCDSTIELFFFNDNYCTRALLIDKI